MTDNDHDIEQPEERVPRRVIGTPSPATGTSLLGTEEHDTAGVPAVPGVIPQDERIAKKGERFAALCFVVTLLAGIAFIVSYVVFQVGDIETTKVSTLALGGTLTVALLALATGIVIWVRMVMPKYNLVQERHPMASGPEAREYVEIGRAHV